VPNKSVQSDTPKKTIEPAHSNSNQIDLLSGPVESGEELGDGLIMKSTDNLSPENEELQAIEEREKASSVKNPVKPDQEIRFNNLLTPDLGTKKDKASTEIVAKKAKQVPVKIVKPSSRKNAIQELSSDQMTSINSALEKRPQSEKGVQKADKSKKTNGSAVTKTNSENVSYVGSINNNNINNFFIQDPTGTTMLQNLTNPTGTSQDGIDELKHSKTPGTLPTKELVPQMQKNNFM
jgi:hypothetical protein